MQTFVYRPLPERSALLEDIRVRNQGLNSHPPHLAGGDQLDMRIDDREEQGSLHGLVPHPQLAAPSGNILVNHFE
jgi:hypothetical protein